MLETERGLRGSVEYNNEEPGAEWIQRLTNAFPKYAWINPEPMHVWDAPTISAIREVYPMVPLTLEGLDDMIKILQRPPSAIQRSKVHELSRGADLDDVRRH